MAEQYPTEEARAKHRAWLVMCCQARFRGEPCDLTEAEFFAIWEPYWAQRGRGRDQMTMTRCDSELPWTRDNVEIITRRDHLVREKNFWKSRL
jgi:hypothetical protein